MDQGEEEIGRSYWYVDEWQEDSQKSGGKIRKSMESLKSDIVEYSIGNWKIEVIDCKAQTVGCEK